MKNGLFVPAGLVLTIVNIADGAVYLFRRECPADRRNWKAELELEQYRHVLEWME